MIKILFFAKYREQAGCDSLELPGAGLLTVADLLGRLKASHPLQTPFLEDKQLLVAINQELARPSSPLHEGDTVAIFPPVTGG